MRAFSASDAIAPAIERTRRYLFHPFEWGTYLKLAAVACITEGLSANFNISYPQNPSSGAGTSTPFNLSSEVIAFIVIAVLVCFAIGILCFYLVTRLRFAFFYCVLYKTKEIRPAWALYGAQAMRLFTAGLAIWMSLLVIASLMALPFALPLYHAFQSAQSGGEFDVGSFFMVFFPLMGIFVIVCLVACAMDVVMHDFMLPHMALEGASFGEAWTAGRPRIGAAKGSFFLFIFLRAFLPLVAMMAMMIVAAIPLLIVGGIVALSAAGFHSVFEDATGAVAVIGVAFEVLFGFIGLCIGLAVAFGLGGPIATLIRNFALIFYGGRCETLGDILYPPTPPAPVIVTADVG
jgi:hypothetical protein